MDEPLHGMQAREARPCNDTGGNHTYMALHELQAISHGQNSLVKPSSPSIRTHCSL